MTNMKSKLAFLLLLCITVACADHRLNRSDEDAMMVYRECMGGAAPQLNSSNMSSSISNSNTFNKNTSIAANAQTLQEQSQQIHCMQLAGWEKK